MVGGKPAPWYIVSRMSNNGKPADAGMGDRTLAIWQGQGYYHFTTYSLPNKNNLVANINYGDIEGLWTFIYYSYDLHEQKAVGLIKYDNDD